MTSDEKLVNDCIQLVRKGLFIAVFKAEGRTPQLPHPQPLPRLRELAKSGKNWLGVTSRAVLAEVYDQVGVYTEAANWATPEKGTQALAALTQECAKKNPDRDVARAHAWLILQCAVAQFRIESGRTLAVNLLTPAINLFATNHGKDALRSHHIESLFHFWLGRIHTYQYDFEPAEDDFQNALDIADSALAEKLHKVEKLPEEIRNAHVAAGNFVLATVLGFGFGQLRQLEGKPADSLHFLRIAVPLFRGTVDYHRRAYSHLLMGIAQRSLYDSLAQLKAAEAQLNIAKQFFGDPEDKDIPPHHLHLARVNHQLALARFSRVPPGVWGAAENEETLKEAENLNQTAEDESNKPSCLEFRDPVLDYGIAVLHSLINTVRGRDHEAADKYADKALGIMKDRQLPDWARGSAFVAKGLAWAGRVKEPEQHEEVRNAENAFEQAFSNPRVRPIDRAAAHLYLALMYSRIDDKYKASIHYDRAIQLPGVQETEYGWVRQLEMRAKEAVGTSEHMCTFHVDQLLERATEKREPAWSTITTHVDEEVRRKLIRLKQSTLQGPDGVTKVAAQLGISRATLYTWLKAPEFKDILTRRASGHSE